MGQFEVLKKIQEMFLRNILKNDKNIQIGYQTGPKIL